MSQMLVISHGEYELAMLRAAVLHGEKVIAECAAIVHGFAVEAADSHERQLLLKVEQAIRDRNK